MLRANRDGQDGIGSDNLLRPALANRFAVRATHFPRPPLTKVNGRHFAEALNMLAKKPIELASACTAIVMNLRLLATCLRISSCLVLGACSVSPSRLPPGDVAAEPRNYAWSRLASEMAQSPATPASLARLDVAKSHVVHRYALGISDGPSEVLVDGALVRQADGGPFPPNLTTLPYEQRAQPYIELMPGLHEITFRVRRHSGGDEQETLVLDARARGHYALVTLELNKNTAPHVRQGTLGDAALAAITAPTPLALIGWPVVLLGAGIWELANAGSAPTTPVCPGTCANWIEDVETRTVVAGHML